LSAACPREIRNTPFSTDRVSSLSSLNHSTPIHPIQNKLCRHLPCLLLIHKDLSLPHLPQTQNDCPTRPPVFESLSNLGVIVYYQAESVAHATGDHSSPQRRLSPLQCLTTLNFLPAQGHHRPALCLRFQANETRSAFKPSHHWLDLGSTPIRCSCSNNTPANYQLKTVSFGPFQRACRRHRLESGNLSLSLSPYGFTWRH